MKLLRVTGSICFEEYDARPDVFEEEFSSFSDTDTDTVGTMIQRIKAKEGKNAPDDVTLYLLAELYRKIDDLSKFVKGETKSLLPLSRSQDIHFAWYDTLKLTSLKPNCHYYGRLSFPLFRQREIGLFMIATDNETACITKMWPHDKADFDSYLAAKEREEIALVKGVSRD